MNIIRIFSASLMMIVLFGFSGQSETFTMVTTDYPPFTYIDKSDKSVRGIFYDLLMAASKEVDMDLIIKVQPLKRAIYSFKAKNIPVYIGPATILQPAGINAAEVNFSKIGYLEMSFSYFKSHHQGKTINWNQLTDFKPYKIGTVLGSPLADKLKPLGVKVESTPTLEAGIKKLFNRRIDIMEGAGVANQYMVKQLYPESLDDYAETEKALMRMDIGFIHWKDNAEATAKLKKFLIGWERIKRNGVFLNIQQKHWGKNVPDSVLKAFGY